ncbi:ribonuclease Z [Hamiltosporidium magnivora]|uniref:ribonuclease Z n=1 Tax=Hamiltosporidium magnivora TaxID=148818 RepID=A0A4Q9LJJ2_9MICR|nr:ribonuclease Z [Hamiltosporidium magnivora]
MIFYFQYISTRSGKSIFLVFEQFRYVFNIFEGFQRVSIESSLKLSKLTAIFLCDTNNVPPAVALHLTLLSNIPVICSSKQEILFRFSKNISDSAKNQKLDFICSDIYDDGFLKATKISFDDQNTYILQLPEIRGKFLFEKIKKYKIPQNLYSKLIEKGKIVYQEKTYFSKDFLEESVVPKNVCILFCNKNIQKFYEKVIEFKVDIFICFFEESLKYFMKRINGEFYLLNDNVFVEFPSFYDVQLSLNQIDRNFLLPVFCKSNLKMKKKIKQISLENQMKTELDEKNFHTKYQYEQDFDSDANDKIENTRKFNANTTYYQIENISTKEILESNDKLIFQKNNSYEIKKNPQIKYKEAKNVQRPHSILFLGTGCAVPSKYRNVSSIIFECKKSAFILDCGEDTLFQIMRIYGNLDILKKIKAIIISHPHADHYLGIISVLRKMKNVLIFGPKFLSDLIELYFEKHTFEIFDIENFFNSSLISSPFKSEEFELAFSRADHCKNSYSVRIYTEFGSISYSGDTRPTKDFIFLSQNVDVMIHEATFGEEEKHLALRTKHSTLDEALDVFRQSGAKKLLLTHFSNRIPKHVECIGINSIICFDFYRHIINEDNNNVSQKVTKFFKSLKNL